MDRHRAGLIAILITCACAASAAQKPNFSGTWIIQEPSKGAGQERTVKLDAMTLSLTSNGRTMTYDLAGTEKKQSIAMRGGGDVVMVNKATWEGNTIVITTTTDYPNNMKTVAKETWSIDSQGHLVIESVETSPTQPKEPPHIVKVVLARKN